MTLPTDIILPLNLDSLKDGNPESLIEYNRNLINVITDMYQDIAQNVNGGLRQWTPKIYGDVTAGDGTYAFQTGWLRRAGLVTELWFDVEWTAHDGTGNVTLELPYKVANSENNPWQGMITANEITFDAGYTYLVLDADPNTTAGRIIQCGSGITASTLDLPATGWIAGYICYIGQEYEN